VVQRRRQEAAQEAKAAYETGTYIQGSARAAEIPSLDPDPGTIYESEARLAAAACDPVAGASQQAASANTREPSHPSGRRGRLNGTGDREGAGNVSGSETDSGSEQGSGGMGPTHTSTTRSSLSFGQDGDLATSYGLGPGCDCGGGGGSGKADGSQVEAAQDKVRGVRVPSLRRTALAGFLTCGTCKMPDLPAHMLSCIVHPAAQTRSPLPAATFAPQQLKRQVQSLLQRTDSMLSRSSDRSTVQRSVAASDLHRWEECAAPVCALLSCCACWPCFVLPQ
jgi:hypothetical protein